MKKQTMKTANSRIEAARETVLDYFGYVRDVRMLIDYPLLGKALNEMGIDALSDTAVLTLNSLLEQAKQRALREMPEDERRELAFAAAF